ncbi:MAG: tetratricopeptide repeat protein [Magnetococcales bacterium]|nr:tetratricopeptide repeat protein [Magnetococcales bacterium]
MRFCSLLIFLAIFAACGSTPNAKPDTARFAALYKKAQAYMDRNNPQMALRSLVKAQELQPDHIGLLAMLGVAYDQLGQDRKSLNVWKKAHLIKPHNGGINHNLGVALMRQQLLDEAKVAFIDALADHKFADRVETYYNLALIQQRRGEIREMVASLKQLLQMYPGHIPSNMVLADYYRKMHRPDLEAKQLRNILTSDSQSIVALERLANLYFQGRNKVKAKAVLERIVEIAPKTAAAKRAKVKLGRISGSK